MEDIRITAFSNGKQLYSYTKTPEEWYDGDVPEIDSGEYIKMKSIDKVEIIQDSKLTIDYFNAEAELIKVESYDENNQLIETEIIK